MSVEIVVARYDEDISWLDCYLEYEHVSITVYNKGREMNNINSKITVKKLDNIGREANTYLSHIVSNYNHLKVVTIFIQGRIDDHIQVDKYEYINTMYEDAYKEGKYQNFCSNADVPVDFRIYDYRDFKLVKFDCNFVDFFRTHINNTYPDSFNVYWCAIFGVSKNNILKRSLYYYKTLLNLEDSTNSELAHFMERSWYYIFDSPNTSSNVVTSS